MIQRLNRMLDEVGTKYIFDHVRNYVICALLLAIGTTELRQPEHEFFGLIPPGYAGIGVIAVAIALICLNLYDGIRRISKSRYHVLLITLLVLAYLFISIRVIEMAWDFRDLAGVDPVGSAGML